MTELTSDHMNEWADNRNGPVALHLRQALLPVEGRGGVIFPPTYAYEDENVHYNIDELSDGTKIATIDSVGSQANRMERIFLPTYEGPYNPRSELVPKIVIAYEDQHGNEKSISILKAGHRLGDAIVRSTELRTAVKNAFLDFDDRDDAFALARIGPTSLVFGAWDSRGTLARIPRVVQSTIRAEDVSELRRSAQYKPPIDYAELDVFTEQQVKSADNPKSDVAQRGYGHVPAVDTHGGVIANGPIRRDVTINLIALRRLDGRNAISLRRYILGLALVAATEPLDGFLRAGCLLTVDPEQESSWESVARTGHREEIALNQDVALDYAKQAAKVFGVGQDRHETFNKAFAQDDMKKAKKKTKGR